MTTAVGFLSCRLSFGKSVPCCPITLTLPVTMPVTKTLTLGANDELDCYYFLDTGSTFRCRCESFRMAIYLAVACSSFDSGGTLTAEVIDDLKSRRPFTVHRMTTFWSLSTPRRSRQLVVQG